MFNYEITYVSHYNVKREVTSRRIFEVRDFLPGSLVHVEVKARSECGVFGLPAEGSLQTCKRIIYVFHTFLLCQAGGEANNTELWKFLYVCILLSVYISA